MVQSFNLKTLGGRGRFTSVGSRSVWSTQRNPGHPGHLVKPCLKKKKITTKHRNCLLGYFNIRTNALCVSGLSTYIKTFVPTMYKHRARDRGFSQTDTVPPWGASFGAEVDGVPVMIANEREIANRVSTSKGSS